MTSTLIFNARNVARLIIHAVDAEQHIPTWGALLEEGARLRGVDVDNIDFASWDDLVQEAKASGFSPEPALQFVKDQGIYLMSNGSPQFDADDPNRVIYAEGFDPSKNEFGEWWEGAREIVGGDDFVEPLPLDRETVKMARAVSTFPSDAGATFHIDVTDETLSYGFELHTVKS
jgi:hypothetical protein